MRRKKDGGSIRRMLEYAVFFLEALIRAPLLCRRERLNVIQVANMPDFLTLALLPIKWFRGIPVMLDMHDLMPELYCSKVGSRTGLLWRVMEMQERAGIRGADLVTTVNRICARIVEARHRGVLVEVLPNCPDPSTFVYRGFLDWTTSDVVRIGYHGTVAPRFGVDTLIQAFSRLRTGKTRTELHIWGDGTGMQAATAAARECGVADRVIFYGQTPVDEMVKGLQSLHISVVPYEADPYMDIAYSTKAFELAAMGIPMVVAQLGGTTEQFTSAAVRFFQPGSADSLADCMSQMIDDPFTANRMVEVARSEVAKFDWAWHGANYVRWLEELAERNRMGLNR